MSATLLIFRKDARRLWPHALVFAAVMAMALWRRPSPYAHAVGLGPAAFLLTMAPILAPLACWVLAVTLVQEERLIGNEQYWLTRPFSWKDLAAAKALFLVAFVNVPLFVGQWVELMAAGFPPLECLPALLARQIFFSIFFVMPAVALAAVTRNLGQVVLSAIVGFLVLAGAVQPLAGPGVADWGGFDWIRTFGAALVMAVGTLSAVTLQYAQRRTALARGIVACTSLLVCLTFVAPRWGGAFTIQKLFQAHTGVNAAVRVAFDEARVGAHPMETSSSSSDPVGVRLEIPVRVDLPERARLALDWVSVGIDGPAGSWRSGWLTYTPIHKIVNGEAWFTVFVDPGYYEKAKDDPVQLSGAVDLTVYRRVGSVTAPERGDLRLAGIGVCSFWPGYSQQMMAADGTKHVIAQTSCSCYSPQKLVSLTTAGADDEIVNDKPYAPFPVSPGFQPWDLTGVWTAPVRSTLTFDRPVAHVQARFEKQGLRMKDYRFR